MDKKIQEFVKSEIRKTEVQLKEMRTSLDYANDTNNVQEQVKLSMMITLKVNYLEGLHKGLKLLSKGEV